MNDNEEGESLANFEPPSKPLSAGSERLEQMRESYEDDDKLEKKTKIPMMLLYQKKDLAK